MALTSARTTCARAAVHAQRRAGWDAAVVIGWRGPDLNEDPWRGNYMVHFIDRCVR